MENAFNSKYTHSIPRLECSGRAKLSRNWRERGERYVEFSSPSCTASRDLPRNAGKSGVDEDLNKGKGKEEEQKARGGEAR